MSGAGMGAAAGAFGAYLLALAALAPASLVDAQLRQASGGAVGLAEARGSLWSGAGRIELRDTRGGLIAGRDATWRVVGATVLAGRLDFELALEGAVRSVPASIAWGKASIGGGSVELPASVIGGFFPTLGALGLSGDLRIDVERFAVARGQLSGVATARWAHAGSIRLSGQRFGDYTMRFESDGATGRAEMTTLNGPVALEGSAQWSGVGARIWRIRATVPAPLRPQLVPLLAMIATRRGEGVYELELR